LLSLSLVPHQLWGFRETVSTPLDRAIVAARPAIGYAVFFTSVTSLLTLVPSLYMINLYDRVMTSRNVNTLMALTFIAVFLLVIGVLVGRFRSSMLMRLGLWCDARVGPELLAAVQTAALNASNRGEIQALRDLDVFRDFWITQGLVTLCAALWSPIFLIALLILHPLLALLAVAAMAATAGLAFAVERAMWPHTKKSAEANLRAQTKARTALRNIEALHAMGMRRALTNAWHREHRAALAWQAQATEAAARFVLASQMLDAFLSVAVMGLAAYLALDQQISPAAIFVANLVFRQATGPLRTAIGQWKGFVNARLAYERLQSLFRETSSEGERVSLPRPFGALSIENVTLAAPGTRQVLLRNVDFAVEPGDILGVVGPSGAGKSTLARALVNVWKPTLGHIRLDGADLDHWPPDELGAHIGYLPQDVELFAGTVAENIRRFGPRDDAGVIAAARTVGVHDLIQSLPAGYNTPLGEDGFGLSGGQRQRIALARAAYGQPALIVLDEPNSNLDAAGEAALTRTLLALKKAGTTVVLITHKAQILDSVDKIAVLGSGTLLHFGPRDEVLGRLSTPKVVPIKRAHELIVKG